MTYKEQLKTKQWKKKRLEILKRDFNRCQYCNSPKKLQVHHLIYISGLKAWEYDNELLITLCKDHHNLIHEMSKVFALIAKEWIINKIDLIGIFDE